MPADFPGAYDHCLATLLKSGVITRTDCAILRSMFWSLRSRGSDLCQAAYDLIVRTAAASKDTVIRTIRKGIELGILIKRKQWGHVRRIHKWGYHANIYQFVIPEEMPEPEVVFAVFDSRKIVPESSEQATSLIESKETPCFLASESVPAREEAKEDAHEGECTAAPGAIQGTERAPTEDAAGRSLGPDAAAAPAAASPGMREGRSDVHRPAARSARDIMGGVRDRILRLAANSLDHRPPGPERPPGSGCLSATAASDARARSRGGPAGSPPGNADPPMDGGN